MLSRMRWRMLFRAPIATDPGCGRGLRPIVVAGHKELPRLRVCVLRHVARLEDRRRACIRAVKDLSFQDRRAGVKLASATRW